MEPGLRLVPLAPCWLTIRFTISITSFRRKATILSRRYEFYFLKPGWSGKSFRFFMPYNPCCARFAYCFNRQTPLPDNLHVFLLRQPTLSRWSQSR
jgi:hypothetical protein